MRKSERQFTVRLAEDRQDILSAQRLRYRVFVTELGAGGDTVDHDTGVEADDFDAHSDHLLLIDRTRDKAAGDHVVGAYRMMTREHAAHAGRFYTQDEYDLGPLVALKRNILELGRSCVHPDYRGGTSMYLLWNALAKYVLDRDVDLMFGVASFYGTDPAQLAGPLSFLYQNHLAPAKLRVQAHGAGAHPMDLLRPDQYERAAVMKEIPALIKAYMRLGGFVGDGAFIDHDFNTTDVFLIMDTSIMNAKSREIYTRKAGR